ncbi:hypothetical protein [Mammaliicoccus sciuri]|uniref:hypothetical protein n=1 Tax=Mammaliicoccus sciuri TaxID=1296 RepID=UPI0021D2846E|nr:hypothetical protein [Mammaliicoccus sciuri]UXV14860.1 hypothetical protein MUA89_09860 [Mammaliicoccus sciuri]UXV25902.1 hypothetical protein MUA96_09850 [Mammaliicoccus sciuri]
MNENDVLSWLVITVIPICVAVASLTLKISKDKRNNENRLTRIESDVKDHCADIDEIKKEQREQREDLKILTKLETQNTMMLDMIKGLSEQINMYQGNNINN